MAPTLAADPAALPPGGALAPWGGLAALGRDPVGDSTRRSACTRVKPLADSHCSISSGVDTAGSSTGKVSTTRGSFSAVRAINSA